MCLCFMKQRAKTWKQNREKVVCEVFSVSGYPFCEVWGVFGAHVHKLYFSLVSLNLCHDVIKCKPLAGCIAASDFGSCGKFVVSRGRECTLHWKVEFSRASQLADVRI